MAFELATAPHMLLRTWSLLLLQYRFGEVPSAGEVKGHLKAFTMGTASRTLQA